MYFEKIGLRNQNFTMITVETRLNRDCFSRNPFAQLIKVLQR